MKRSTILAAALAALPITFSSAAAQQPTPPLRLEITPFAGAAAPLADLPTTFRLETADGGQIQLDGAELDAAAAFGGAVGLRWGRQLGVEASLAYVPTQVSATVDGAALDTDLDLFLAGGNLSWFVPVPSTRLQPYLTAGAGAKIYDYALADTDTHADFSVNWGGGLAVRVSPMLQLRLDARDHVSWLDPEVAGMDAEAQHDAVLSAGLSLSVPLSGMPVGGRGMRR